MAWLTILASGSASGQARDDTDKLSFQQHRVSAENPAEAIILPGGSFTARLGVRNDSDQPVSDELTFVLLDFWERQRQRKTVRLDLQPGQQRELPVVFEAPREYGIFKVRLTRPLTAAGGQTRSVNLDLASFASLPQIRQFGADSFFGWHFRQSNDAELGLARRLGVSWNRTFLAFVPRPGFPDGEVEAHRRHGIELLGQLFQDEEGHPVRNIDAEAFGRKVAALVGRYPHIRYWELFNECEHPSFYDLSDAEYAQLVRTAHAAMKSANPKAELVLSGFTMDAKLFDRRMAMLAAEDSVRFASVLSIHYYSYPGPRTPEMFRDWRREIDGFNTVARRAMERTPPIWNTEGGPMGRVTSFYDYEGLEVLYPELKSIIDQFGKDAHARERWYHVESAYVVKMDAVMQAMGIRKNFMYLMDYDYPRFGFQWNPWKSYCWREFNNAPRPVMIARAICMMLIDGLTPSGFVEDDERSWYAVVYDAGDGRSISITWSDRPDNRVVATALDARIAEVRNVMGNLVRNPPATAVTVPRDEVVYTLWNAPPADVLKALRQARLTTQPGAGLPETEPVREFKTDGRVWGM